MDAKLVLNSKQNFIHNPTSKKVDFWLSQKFILKSYIDAKSVLVSREIFISKSYAKFFHFEESQT
jgi:hypothetical protein